MYQKNKNRPIVLVANSSWYLYHYRKKLISTLNRFEHVITISPFDSSSYDLGKISLNILWKINKYKEKNFLSFCKSLIRMILIIRTIKPKLIHSHTIKANLVISFVSFIFNIPNVLSFTGLGRLSNGGIFAQNFLKVMLKIILFFSTHKFSKMKISSDNSKRGYFIFQNPRDLNYFFSHIDLKKIYNYKLIYGSGIPNYYVKEGMLKKNIWDDNINKKESDITKIDLIFCGRLLKSKGINLFLEIAKQSDINNAFIYGSNSHESISLFPKEDKYSDIKQPNKIKFMGNLTDPLLNLNSSKPILIVPSFYGEGISRTILEAMCLGIPVICSKNAAVETFTQEVVYIPEKNEISYYIDCINKLNSDYENNFLNKKLTFAKEWCVKNFKEEKIVNETKKVYKDLKVI